MQIVHGQKSTSSSLHGTVHRLLKSHPCARCQRQLDVGTEFVLLWEKACICTDCYQSMVEPRNNKPEVKARRGLATIERPRLVKKDGRRHWTEKKYHQREKFSA